MALLTAAFEPQGAFVATAAGMPGVPQLVLPHPVAGRGDEYLQALAAEVAPRVVAILRGEPAVAERA